MASELLTALTLSAFIALASVTATADEPVEPKTEDPRCFVSMGPSFLPCRDTAIALSWREV